MNISIIVIGDELLLGQVADTNSCFIARSVTPLGWTVESVHTIADKSEDIYEAIDNALRHTDIVITTGGLGPTKDDITKATLCRYFNCATRFDSSVESNIEQVFKRRGLKMNALTRNQAIVPENCTVIQNRLGTAPIMWFEKNIDGKRKILVSMPGVPFETEGMLPEVLKRIKDTFAPDSITMHESFIVTDVTESDLAERLDTYERHLPEALHLAYLPSPGYIRLRLDAIGSIQSQAELETQFKYAKSSLTDLLADNLLYIGDATPAQIVLSLAKTGGHTVSVAESCTGGTIAARITAEQGASAIYYGSVVSYSNDMKQTALGVDPQIIATHGAVSEETVEQMSEGVRRLAGTDSAIATSGIAGPTGGTAEKPIGTVWIAARVGNMLNTQCFRFPGNRARVIDRAATTALIMLAKMLKKN